MSKKKKKPIETETPQGKAEREAKERQERQQKPLTPDEIGRLRSMHGWEGPADE